jgi:protein-S-isoprenylcysteine O-methyltransferase Ste14
LLTLKLFDIHIRSTEPTLAGWMVALICYPPFWNMAERSFLHYEDNYYWGEWLEPWPVLKFFWALAILCCVTIYVWATVSFGVRFSNLTNRGILTNGPYGLLMHPAYVSKNLSWWLISVPFVVTGSLADALTNCLLLAGINLIYFARAKTEERHLLRDPAYQAYALWMRAYGPGARLRRAMGLTAGLAGVR